MVNPDSVAIRRLMVLQFNPETLTRSFQIMNLAGQSGDRSEALRLTGPPVETIKLDAEIDKINQLQRQKQFCART